MSKQHKTMEIGDVFYMENGGRIEVLDGSDFYPETILRVFGPDGHDDEWTAQWIVPGKGLTTEAPEHVANRRQLELRAADEQHAGDDGAQQYDWDHGIQEEADIDGFGYGGLF